VLIVGAGGATRGVVAPLLVLQPAELVVANRTAERAQAFASDFADLGTVRGCGFEDIGADGFDVVINATSASLSGEVPAIPASVILPGTVCYDMAYGRNETSFLKWAREHGCEHALQGWGMLVEQAAESFQLWRGVRPQTAPVLAALRERASAANAS
jgi:shikimate dehydrogenase